MDRQCRATKADGSRCTLPTTGQQDVCWAHAPENAERRRRAASRGGRSKANKEVKDLKTELKALIERVNAGELEPSQGNTMIRGYGVLLEYIKLERGIFVEEDLGRRVEALKRGEHSDAS